MPLVLPFFCSGLTLTQQTYSSIIGLLLCVLITIGAYFSHRWIAVQNERSLPPNG